MKGKENTHTKRNGLTIAILIVLLFVSLGICSRVAVKSYQQNMERGEAEAALAARQLENWLDHIIFVTKSETAIAEDLLKKGLSHTLLEEQLRERNGMLASTVHPAIRNVALATSDWYACGNWWTPPKGYQPGNRDWFKQLVAGNGNVVLTDPYPALDFNTPCVTVGCLLSDGKTVLDVDVDLSAFSETARNSLNGRSIEVLFYGPNGLELGGAGKTDNTSSYYEFSNVVKGGWKATVRIDRARVNASIRDAAVVSAIWCSILSVLLFMILEHYIRSKGKATKGDLAATMVLVFIAGVFAAILVAVHRTSSERERKFALHLGTEEVRKSVAPFDEFLRCAQASVEFSAKHIEGLLRRHVSDQELYESLKNLNDELRSVYGMNYKNVFVARQAWIVNSLGWTPPPDFDFSKREWFRKAKASPGRTIVTSPYQAAEDDSMDITIARMLPDEKCTIVAIDITLQMIDFFAEGIGIEGAKCAMIISHDGGIVCHHAVGESKEIHDLACQQRVAQHALQEESSFLMKDDSGRDIVVFLTPIRFNGRAVVCADAEIVNHFVVRQGLDELVFMATLFVAALFFAWHAFGYIRRGRLAEAANVAKSTFLFNMSHDIRTPMNAILGFTAMGIKHIGDQKKVLDCLNKTQQAGNLLLMLINNVLDMSRIEAGHAELQENPGDVTLSFINIESAMQEIAKSRDISLTFGIGEVKDRYVYADFTRCTRVLTNLISNAIKYNHEGGYVKVTCEQVAPAADGYASYKYTIEDNGIGMSKEFQKHMFESFSREQSSTASGVQGTGLGLSVCKTFIEVMKGTIECKSTQGKGTTFIITLPFKLQDKKQYTDPAIGEIATATSEIPVKNRVALNGRKVLLVEDNELNREIASEILDEEGALVEEAEDGSVAVKILQEKGPDHYDFVLMDIQMPVMNGYEATKAIREMPGFEKLPIIALSANAFAEDKQKSLEAGMNDHVAKPIKPKELFAALAKFL